MASWHLRTGCRRCWKGELRNGEVGLRMGALEVGAGARWARFRTSSRLCARGPAQSCCRARPEPVRYRSGGRRPPTAGLRSARPRTLDRPPARRGLPIRGLRSGPVGIARRGGHRRADGLRWFVIGPRCGAVFCDRRTAPVPSSGTDDPAGRLGHRPAPSDPAECMPGALFGAPAAASHEVGRAALVSRARLIIISGHMRSVRGRTSLRVRTPASAASSPAMSCPWRRRCRIDLTTPDRRPCRRLASMSANSVRS